MKSEYEIGALYFPGWYHGHSSSQSLVPLPRSAPFAGMEQRVQPGSYRLADQVVGRERNPILSGGLALTEDDNRIKIETDKLEAAIPKKNPKHWMTGIEKGSFLDKTTGFREIGDGLMVIDWLMESGSDKDYGDFEVRRTTGTASAVIAGTRTKPIRTDDNTRSWPTEANIANGRLKARSFATE